MKDDELKLCVQNLLLDENAKKYLKELVTRSGCLNNSVCLENPNKNYFLQGCRLIGYSILDDICKFSYQHYEEFIRKDI